MFELKRLSTAAIPRALAKAERYRLLNEPEEAESICLDVLDAEPNNQQALTTLLLALTDGFSATPPIDIRRPREVLPRLRDSYEKHYYGGLIFERWGRALLARHMPTHVGLGWLREAMREYELAFDEAPAANEDALLRWNACVRVLQKEEWQTGEPVHASLDTEPSEDDEMPPR